MLLRELPAPEMPIATQSDVSKSRRNISGLSVSQPEILAKSNF